MKRSDPRRGVILVTVLWSIALLSALAMAAAVTFRGFAGVMAVERDRVQADALLSAGLETAAGMIDVLGDAPLMDTDTTVGLTTGSVHLHLSDEGGRVDIGKAPVLVLAALLRSVGAPEAAANDVAQRIVDRRNPGSAARSGATHRSTNGLGKQFSDLRQLKFIPGMAPEWLSAIEPLATVFGSDTVNPLTAPPNVIAALPGVDGGQVAAFLRARRSPQADAGRLVQMLGSAQQYLLVKSPRVASVELAAALADGFAVAARAVIVVLPQDSEPYRVLAWTTVPSPRLL